MAGGGFNPCFAGCPSGSGSDAADGESEERFQSLFCWMSLWIINYLAHPDAIRRRFNPCFAGCPSGSSSYVGLHPPGLRFNPCFAGCPSGSIRLSCCTLAEPMFQSLFCWMSLWIGGRTSHNATPLASVSILVLLDVPLDLCPREIPYSKLSPFQSLFCWMSLWIHRQVST